MKCKFCEKDFKSTSILNNHQKTAKYCLKIQNIEHNNFNCEYCNKKYTQNIDLQRHLLKCSDYKFHKIIEEKDKIIKEKDKIIEEKDKQLKEKEKEIKETLERIAKTAINRPTTTNNTTNNNLMMMTSLDMNKEQMTQIIEDKFTKNDIVGGQKGVAQFTKREILTDKNDKLKYKCTDPSRNICKYKNGKGEIERDVKCDKLTEAISSPVRNKTNKLVLEDKSLMEDMMLEVGEINDLLTNKEEFIKEICKGTCN